MLNAQALTEAVRPLQGRGEHNPRHFDKYVWQLPIPLYDPADTTHQRLAELATECEALVASLDLKLGKRFEAVRRFVREALAASKAGAEVEDIVTALLASERAELLGRRP